MTTYTCGRSTHRHVDAANFGVHADAYRAVGGRRRHRPARCRPDLLRRLAVGGLVITRPSNVAVVTSSRIVGHLRGGFAATLARLNRTTVATARTA